MWVACYCSTVFKEKDQVAFPLFFWNILLHPCLSLWSCLWESLNDLRTVSTCSWPLAQSSLWLSSALSVTAMCLALPQSKNQKELKSHFSSAKGSGSIFCISLHFECTLPITLCKRIESISLQLFHYLGTRLSGAWSGPLFLASNMFHVVILLSSYFSRGHYGTCSVILSLQSAMVSHARKQYYALHVTHNCCILSGII